MFSEQYRRKDEEMSKKKTSKEEKSLTFDRLEDKLSSMNIKEKEGKAEAKYSPGGQIDRVRMLSAKGKTKSASVIVQKEKHLQEGRSNSLEKHHADSVSFGLFEAANVMCNIVEISKDSTMQRRSQDTYAAAPSRHAPPAKASSKSSITSISSQSGPFAMLKESERKKKKSIDDEDD